MTLCALFFIVYWIGTSFSPPRRYNGAHWQNRWPSSSGAIVGTMTWDVDGNESPKTVVVKLVKAAPKGQAQQRSFRFIAGKGYKSRYLLKSLDNKLQVSVRFWAPNTVQLDFPAPPMKGLMSKIVFYRQN